VASLAEVFRLQGAEELERAEERYLPRTARTTRAIILGSIHGAEFGSLTDERPKCMLEVAGAPILLHVVEGYRAAGVTDIVVARGYKKQAIQLDGVGYCDNDAETEPTEGYSLFACADKVKGNCIISYGDVLFRKYIPQELMEIEDDFVVMVDTNWRESRNRERYADYVTCTEPSSRSSFRKRITLKQIAADIPLEQIHGEWMGFLKLTESGSAYLRSVLERLYADSSNRPILDMAALLRELIHCGKELRVVYTTGSWMDVDRVEDVLAAGSFQTP